MSEPTVVRDISTLVRLRKGNALHCLTALSEKIFIPRAVYKECLESFHLDAIREPLFDVRQLQEVLALGMGAGEREALSLAVELSV